MHRNNERWSSIPGALLALAVGLLILALVGCGAGGGSAAHSEEREQDAREEGPVTGEFVGEVSDTGTLFALVADEPEGGEREVSAYLCDGGQLSEWFTAANDVRLSSESGVEIEARITPRKTTGTITTSAGETNEVYDFEAPPVEGVEGFYSVTVLAGEGSLGAEAWSGARLEGTRNHERLSLTLTPEGGEPVEVEAEAPGLEAGENRWIVSREGGRLLIKGAKKGAATTGYIDPVSDLRKPGFIDPVSDI